MTHPAPSRRQDRFWRIVISLVGVGLIVMALGNLAIYMAGDSAAIFAVKTRREGGADNAQQADARYVWVVSYSFKDRQGVIHDGQARRRGGDMGIKVERRVYYLPDMPFFNALEDEARPNVGQAVMIALGFFLLYVMNRKAPGRKATGNDQVAIETNGEGPD